MCVILIRIRTEMTQTKYSQLKTKNQKEEKKKQRELCIYSAVFTKLRGRIGWSGMQW
jgi:hypothetical protein